MSPDEDRASSLAALALERVSPSTRDALTQASGDQAVFAAFALIHADWRHISGLSAAEITDQLHRWRPQQEWAHAVVRSISDFRRAGVVGPLADNLGLTWSSYLLLASQAAHTAGVIRPDDDPGVIDDVDRHFLASKLRHLLHPLPDPEPFARRLAGMVGVDTIPNFEQHVGEVGLTFRLDARHLDPFRRILLAIDLYSADLSDSDALPFLVLRAELSEELEPSLTPVEHVGLFPDPIERRKLDAVLAESARLIMIPHMAAPFWADTYPEETEARVPSWVEDQVLTGGARSQKYTTGGLHSWLLVSEGPWDRSRVERTLYEVTALGFSVDENELVLGLLLPEHAGDQDALVQDFTYDVTRPSALQSLLTLVATKVLRLEAFAIDSGTLRFLGAIGIPLPEDLVERISEIALQVFGERFSSDASRLFAARVQEQLVSDDDQAAARFAGSENARHELMWELSALVSRGHLPTATRTSIMEARDVYLSAESARGRSTLLGLPDDETAVTSARAALARALSVPRSRTSQDDLLATLPSGTAFLHLDFRDDVIDCCLAGNRDGTVWYRWLQCDPRPSLASVLDQFLMIRHLGPQRREVPAAIRARALDALLDELAGTLEGLAELLEVSSIEQLIVSTGGVLDGLPVHLVSLGNRVRRISYAPSVRFLSGAMDLQPTDVPRVAVLSFAGSGDALTATEFEAQVVAELHAPRARKVVAASVEDFVGACGTDMIHIACHGLAGTSIGSRGLLLSPGNAEGFLPSTEIIRRCSLVGTRLVYLSACSSSVADHTETLIQSFGGVDFACIAAGARAAVATLWDVNDFASAMFAAVFHAALADGGEISAAYHAAQAALADDLALMPPRLSEILNDFRPQWAEEWERVPLRTHRLHWGAFRLSGHL